MNASPRVFAAVLVATLFAPAARGAEPDCSRIGPKNVTRCALRTSLTVRSSRAALEAARANETAAAPLLPSNPELAVAAGRRTIPAGPGAGLHWSATISQELEIAGQRSARRDQARAESSAQQYRVTATGRIAAARAWEAYFDVVFADRAQRLAARVQAVADETSAAAKAMVSSGLLSPVEADLAEMASLRAKSATLAAASAVANAKLTLASLMGFDPPQSGVRVEGDLAPIPGVEVFARRALATRQIPLEALALEAERDASNARARAFRRSRVPNITVGVFVEHDEFEGQVIGASLSLPIPLPHPVGRTFAGEIAESEALARRAATDAALARREARLSLARALASYDSRRAELDALGPERVNLAERTLDGLVSEVKSGRVGVREALVTRQQLIEFLQARLDAERGLTQASVDLAVAANFPFEKEAP